MTIKHSSASLRIAQFLASWVWGYSYLIVKHNVPLDITKMPVVNPATPGKLAHRRNEINI